MTIRILLVCFLLPAIIFNAEGINPIEGDPGTTTKPEPGIFSTVLFEVTSPNSDHVSYLFGTHHAFGKKFFDTLTIAKEKLLASDLLIKENLTLPGHTSTDIINARTATTSWKKYLSKSDYAFTLDMFSKSPIEFEKMTPTELHVFLSRLYKERVCQAKAPEDKSLSLDDYIGSLAREANLPLKGLETTEEQLELIRKDIEGMPRKVHKRRLAAMVEKIRSSTNRDCAETSWYANMEIDYQLDQVCGNSLLLTDRNARWMEQLQEILPQQNCFVAVGLSHLMYKCGLINHIRKLGYTVTPIPVK